VIRKGIINQYANNIKVTARKANARETAMKDRTMGRRLLIVDDIATNRIVLKVKLAAACYDTVQAASGAEALRRARADRPDLILLDLGLPDMDGLDVLARLRDDVVTRNIPVIVISARTGAQARIAALNAGADEILPKPVDDPVLLARVRSLLRAREVAQDLGANEVNAARITPIPPTGPVAKAETGAQGDGRFGLTAKSPHSAAYPALEPSHGMAEAPVPFLRPGLIALIAQTEDEARTWRARLAPLLQDQMIVLNRAGALAAASRTPPAPKETAASRKDLVPAAPAPPPLAAPDIYVIAANLSAAGDGLRLMSDLRSRPASHHAAICIVTPPGDRDAAAMALDLGANDLLPAEATAEEIALRLRMQMRLKQVGDQNRRQVQDQLRLAVQDPLTGLYNRHYAMPQLARIAEHARRSGQAYAVLLLDLDRFKSVNDRYGHVAGDHVLAEVANRLQRELRPMDLLARIGGEEFLVVLPDATLDGARTLAERLCRAIEGAPFALPDGSGALHVTISVGLALESEGAHRARPITTTSVGGAAHAERPFQPKAAKTKTDEGAEPDAMRAGCLPSGSAIERADKALLSAKAHGRNRVTVCDRLH
jgi:two-component system cell cycle response regulator